MAAPDLVERGFTAAAPNTLWVADLTFIKPLQGILYLAAALDVFSARWWVGMRSPDEYEAAFYADTTNANPDTLVKVGNRESSLQ